MCGGPGEEMGTLGRNTYARCQDCGFDFVDESEREAYDEEPKLDPEEMDGIIQW
jgi:hypothetical protein